MRNENRISHEKRTFSYVCNVPYQENPIGDKGFFQEINTRALERTIALFCGFMLATLLQAQDLKTFFTTGDTATYLGIDYSQVKVISNFSQFMGAGEKDAGQLRDNYIPAWNKLVLDGRKK